MESDFMTQLCEKLVDNGISFPSQTQGCSSEEIKQLENHFACFLPDMYKNFLYYMGHRAGRFFLGTDMFYKNLFEIKHGAIDLLEDDNSSFSLGESHFVFYIHQGYHFKYFNLTDDHDPLVYYYHEGKMNPKKEERFSDFLIKSVDEHIIMFEELKKLS